MVRAEPIKKEEYFGGKIQRRFLQPPYAVYRLQSFLQNVFRPEIEEGLLKIDVFDPALSTVDPDDCLDSILGKIREEDYDIFGFSPIRVLLGEDLVFMDLVHEAAAKSDKRPLFIAGGNEAAINNKVMFGTMPWLDFCVHGYGEPALSRIINRIYRRSAEGEDAQKGAFVDIDGLIYNTPDGITSVPHNPITHNAFRSYSLYAGTNIPYEKYWAYNRGIAPADNIFTGATVETARIFTRSFCPFNCSFCSQSAFAEKLYSGRPVSLAVRQITHVIKEIYESKGAKGIYFNDDDMFGTKKNAKDMLEAIIIMKAHGDIPQDMKFFGQTVVTMVDEDILSLAEKAGFAYISFGAESFDDQSLSAVDLRKPFRARQAIESVKASIRAKIPITNINLILFPPTITRERFIRTVEQTVELLRESIKYRSKLSVNSFPLIEDYAGVPLEGIAAERNWPIQRAALEHDGKEWEYIVSFLPVDEGIRGIVENDRLLEELDRTMKELNSDEKWPSMTVSGSIGVNGLAMFVAAYRLLNIGPQESQVTIENMTDLIWQLMETFNPSVEQSASILSRQDGDLVFIFSDNRLLVRKGSESIKGIPPEIVRSLARKNEGIILVSLKSTDPSKMRDALQEAVYKDISLEEAFVKQGIDASRIENGQSVHLIGAEVEDRIDSTVPPTDL